MNKREWGTNRHKIYGKKKSRSRENYNKDKKEEWGKNGKKLSNSKTFLSIQCVLFLFSFTSFIFVSIFSSPTRKVYGTWYENTVVCCHWLTRLYMINFRSPAERYYLWKYAKGIEIFHQKKSSFDVVFKLAFEKSLNWKSRSINRRCHVLLSAKLTKRALKRCLFSTRARVTKRGKLQFTESLAAGKLAYLLAVYWLLRTFRFPLSICLHYANENGKQMDSNMCAENFVTEKILSLLFN
jgi:hypothetical protein